MLLIWTEGKNSFRGTTQIWVVTRHQKGYSALVSHFAVKRGHFAGKLAQSHQNVGCFLGVSVQHSYVNLIDVQLLMSLTYISQWYFSPLTLQEKQITREPIPNIIWFIFTASIQLVNLIFRHSFLANKHRFYYKSCAASKRHSQDARECACVSISGSFRLFASWSKILRTKKILAA